LLYGFLIYSAELSSGLSRGNSTGERKFSFALQQSVSR